MLRETGNPGLRPYRDWDDYSGFFPLGKIASTPCNLHVPPTLAYEGEDNTSQLESSHLHCRSLTRPLGPTMIQCPGSLSNFSDSKVEHGF